MNVLDLFSGVGGFSLGFEAAGMQTVAFCEIEPYCQSVLRERWPRVPIHDDVHKLDGSRYRGTVDLVCGGYPCQPFSMAGRRAGAEDERHLWPEMLRVIRGCRPRWVVAENVAGHITLGFDEVAASLEAEGFTVWPFVIPACAVGAPHRRNRLWIVAHAKGAERHGIWALKSGASDRPADCRAAVANSKSPCRIKQAAKTNARTTGRQSGNGSVGCCKAVANAARLQPRWEKQRAKRKRAGTSSQPVPAPMAHAYRSGRVEQRRPLPASSQFLAPQCSGWWELEPRVGRVASRVSHRVDRLRALGNAIVPQIAAIIGQAIMKYDREAR